MYWFLEFMYADHEIIFKIIANIKKTYVVSNAPKELKEKANYKTKSNNLKGVEQVIKKETKIN